MNLPEGEEAKARQPNVKRGNKFNQDNVELRRPHGASVNQPAESISGKNIGQLKSMQISERKHTDPHRSSLSVDAAEFVPKSCSMQKVSVQNRINIAREMPPKVYTEPTATKDHVEDALQQYDRKHLQNTQNSQDTHGSRTYNPNIQNNDNKSRKNDQSFSNSQVLGADSGCHNFTIFDYLERIIITLISNPGDFDDLVPSFINDFRREGNMRYIQIIVTNIVDWSITESNFRYNGARFCTYFDDTSRTIERLLFRDTLHYICKFEIVMQEFDWQSGEQRQNKCPGLILFLAELIAQMDENFAFTLGGLLIQFITNILKKPASNIVKYVCQALKLAGERLEKDKSKSTEIENMMRALTELVTKGQVDTQVGNMVHSVHELRNDNWGRSTSDSPITNVALPSQQAQQALYEPGASNHNSFKTNASSVDIPQPSEEPLYGPDGQIVLSAEETKFLQDHLKEGARMFEDPYMDDNYDDEIASAYEEFLRENST